MQGSLSVRVFSMRNANDDHDALRVGNRENHAISAHPQTIPVVARELFALYPARIMG